MLNLQELTEEELEELIRFAPLEEKKLENEEVALILAVLEERARRRRQAHPEETAANEVRGRAWWQLVSGEISPSEYHDIILSTALTEEEKQTLLPDIPGAIDRALQCRELIYNA